MARKKVVAAVPEVNHVAQVLYNRTIKFTGKYFSVTKDKPSVPTKLKPIIDALNEGDWGCQRVSVIKLVSAVFGEDLSPFLDEEEKNTSYIDCDDLAIGVILVPTKDECNHNYELETPCMVIKSGYSCDLLVGDGSVCENDFNLDLNCLRLPTLHEVVKFVSNPKVSVELEKYIVLS